MTKKYKAIVKYKIGISEEVEFESSATNPSDVLKEIKEHLREDLDSYANNGFFFSDDVKVEAEVADVSPVESAND